MGSVAIIVFVALIASSVCSAKHHCIFKYQPQHGMFEPSVKQAYDAIQTLQPIIYSQLPDFKMSKRYEYECDWVTYIRCDLDDTLTKIYVDMALDFAKESVKKQTPSVLGLSYINRFLYDVDENETLLCKYYSSWVKPTKPTSLGLTVTLPATSQEYVFDHTKTIDYLNKTYNKFKIKIIPGDMFGEAPLTRLSGHFRWKTKIPKCQRHLSEKQKEILIFISKIPFDRMNKSNIFVNRLNK